MGHIEVECRYLVPQNEAVDMSTVMRHGWEHNRMVFANILFDVTDPACSAQWQIQRGNKTLRARCFFPADISLAMAAQTDVETLIGNKDTEWTLKEPIKKGEGKREITDIATLAQKLFSLSEKKTQALTREQFCAALRSRGILPFSTIFTGRDIFTNRLQDARKRPHVVTWDESLCHHDVTAAVFPRRIVEIETQVPYCERDTNKLANETKAAQAKNMAWAKDILFPTSKSPWLQVSGTSAMCVLRHLPPEAVGVIYAGRSLGKLRNSYTAGEISAERIHHLIAAGVLSAQDWRDIG